VLHTVAVPVIAPAVVVSPINTPVIVLHPDIEFAASAPLTYPVVFVSPEVADAGVILVAAKLPKVSFVKATPA